MFLGLGLLKRCKAKSVQDKDNKKCGSGVSEFDYTGFVKALLFYDVKLQI